MQHILLISDNRRLLSSVFSWLAPEGYRLYVATYSTNAFELFLESNADVVILDMDCVVPYRTILQMFEQSQREYSVVLLCSREESLPSDSRTYLLSKENLTELSIKEAVSASTKMQKSANLAVQSATFNLRGNMEFVAYPDMYFMLHAKHIGEQKKDFTDEYAQFKAVLAPIGATELSALSADELFLRVRKSQVRDGFNFSDIGNLLISVMGNDFAVLYKEGIKWQNMETALLEFERLSAYFYFIKGESLSNWELTARIRPISFKKLHVTHTELLSAMLKSDADAAEKYLKVLYIHHLKRNVDIPARSYIRHVMRMFGLIFSSISGEGFLDETKDYESVEQEYSVMCKRFAALCENMKPAKLMPVVVKTALLIYSRFSEDIFLDSIADELSVSKIYLGRVFKSQVGITVLEFLQFVRMQHANFLLAESDMKIGQIAKLVGYHDAAYFSRLFRKYSAMSPEKYRNHTKSSLETEVPIESTMEIGKRFAD